SEIEVAPWFEAFGLPGAEELVPKDGARLWQALDRAGTALLRGQAPDAADLKAVNALLARAGEAKLPSKPGKDIARKLFGSAWQFRQALGLPEGESSWQERHRAA